CVQEALPNQVVHHVQVTASVFGGAAGPGVTGVVQRRLEAANQLDLRFVALAQFLDGGDPVTALSVVGRLRTGLEVGLDALQTALELLAEGTGIGLSHISSAHGGPLRPS